MSKTNSLRSQIDMAFAAHSMLSHTQLIDSMEQLFSTLLDTIQTDVIGEPEAIPPICPLKDAAVISGRNNLRSTQQEKMQELKEKL